MKFVASSTAIHFLETVLMSAVAVAKSESGVYLRNSKP